MMRYFLSGFPEEDILSQAIMIIYNKVNNFNILELSKNMLD